MEDLSLLWADDIKGMHVVDGEFLVTTSDSADRTPDAPVSDLLDRVRQMFDMDIVFISQFVDGQRVIRHVAAGQDDGDEFTPGDRDPLEETFCQRIVDGRAPQLAGEVAPPAEDWGADARRQVGAYVTVPITAPTGTVYGTLCCLSRTHRPQLGARSELQAIRSVAELLSSVLARGR